MLVEAALGIRYFLLILVARNWQASNKYRTFGPPWKSWVFLINFSGKLLFSTGVIELRFVVPSQVISNACR